MKNKYPRFFIPNRKDGWYHDTIYYFRINKMYGDTIAILKNGGKVQSSWTENGCEDNVKKGWWKEIPEEEAVLL